jgi:hypothetical protein
MFAPWWKVRLARCLLFGKKLARLPRYVNVGACDWMHSSIRGGQVPHGFAIAEYLRMADPLKMFFSPALGAPGR